MHGKPISLRDTYIFSQMNKGGYVDNVLKTFANPNTAMVATPKLLEEQIIHINKTFKYPAKVAVLEAFKNGTITPVLLKPSARNSARIPSSIPFVFDKGRTKAMVFIDNYANVTKNLDITIDYKKLYCLLESAYLALEGYNRDSTSVINKGSAIFAHMFTQVLNKKFSLNTDRTAKNKVLFLASKYFLYHHLGMRDEDRLFNYALKNCNSATAILMKDVDAEFGPQYLESLPEFIKHFADTPFKFVNGFENITVRDYISDFANMYGQETLLALESLDYFMFVISSVTIGAFLNNQVVLDEIVGDDGKKLYFEMSR